MKNYLKHWTRGLPWNFLRGSSTVAWCLMICLWYSHNGHCQSPHTANWIFSLGFGEKGARLNFNSIPPTANQIDTNIMNIFSSNLSMSNEAGELIFYGNGCYIANAKHQMMPNSEDLTPGFVVDAQCPHGSPYSESQIALKATTEEDTYYLFQTINQQTFEPPSDPEEWAFAPFDLVYSKIDMTLDNGLGVLTDKHISLLADTLSNNGFQAIKHANGVDWWLVAPEYATNCYHTILFAADTFSIQTRQCIGYEWGFIDMGCQSAVSLDGSKYARYTPDQGVTLLDFDRCTGRFHNPQHFAESIAVNRVGGISFSPNGKLLYLTTRLKLFQFDLQVPNIEASKILIAEYDGVTNPTATDIFRATTGNDEKIYWNTWRNTYNLHVINAPNKVGVACDFVHRAITLPEQHFGSLPSFPNYGLGPLAEPCAITSTDDCIADCQATELYLYPNPTTGRVTIAGEVEEGYQLELYDMLGRKVFQHSISRWQEEVRLPAALGAGIYIYKILDGERCIRLDRLYVF